MNIETTWAELKRIADAKGMSLQWVDNGDRYHIALVEGPFIVFTVLDKADATEFETSYKATGNKQVSSLQSTFAAKTVGSKKIFARNTGMQFALAAGANTLTYTATLPWAKVTGVEIINAEALDWADFKVKDTPAGTYSGVPNYTLNQFGFTYNVAPVYCKREATFDADLYQGMVLEFTYNSVSAKSIGINLIMTEVK